MTGWDLLVDRGDLRKTTFAATDPEIPLADGEALLAVESFALTANNVTYGAVGDQIGYWKFFPAPEGQGRIPVWGYARVVRSASPEAPEGLRLFGYWPMSSHTVARLSKRPSGYVEVSAHRAELPPTYNAYQVAAPAADDDWRSLLRPLFMTSFLLDDQVAEAAPKTLVLSSASSKTAMGLAWLARKRGIKVIGLTSPAHVALLERLGLYDAVAAYEAIRALTPSGPAAYVDFAGRSAVTRDVHETFGEALKTSTVVGVTHWDAMGGPPPSVGPTPVFFFAPDRIRQLMKDWGPRELESRFATALKDFIAGNGWLTLKQHVGPEALQAIYGDVVAGKVKPDEGHIVRPA
ncbi:MAG: DUF2855 family protein [Alphaproteobacteria bacterium]|nr:DUF2855 family protein [Alphaproteobacteria bacterium]MBU1513352.1 DUF2855 family protein [Alphaproteobacteria bacterium]MBU2096344.1 DUF2855 family protein [Alphaproteobacteria bacterium]MBU2149964.1 DUF2855 family protein [Alphaproteobacteria bacterium]MBU2309838.1 DUF2855 family protein [Alphaproteobacteria bacterium]